MQAFKNILIEVRDFENPLDSTLLNIIKILKVEKIFFYSFSQENAGGDEFKKIDLFKDNHFSEDDTLQYDILILEKDFSKSILKASLLHDIDLVIFDYGSSHVKKEEVVKLAKNSHCSVLTLPDNTSMDGIQTILVPLDFSAYSRKAFECALEIAEMGNTKVVVNHVYSVPATYHATGKSYEETALVEKQSVKKECQKFLKEYDLYNKNISYSYILDDDKDPTDKIHQSAIDNNADLLIIGGKGKTQSMEVVSGSIAFSLLLYNRQIPMLVIKNKKENYDLVEEIIRKAF